ncbi:MAG: GNAT family N-acetyltransferase [Deltaproteobacteria bacterium]|nr:GNAT family N-acetyltransferase [Deltaproteobacteria bacterium]
MSEQLDAEIQMFKTEDMDKILEIEGKAFPKTAYSKDVFAHYAWKCPNGFFVIRVGEEIVGYILFDETGHIYSTAIEPEHRRKGLGRMLFNHACRTAKTELRLEVRSKNVSAIEFYEGLGMTAVRRIPNYYETDDALIMVLGEDEPEV